VILRSNGERPEASDKMKTLPKERSVSFAVSMVCRCLALFVAISLGATKGVAQSVHLIDDFQIGAGVFSNLLKGAIWGYSPGIGRLDSLNTVAPILFASVPLGGSNLDLYAAHHSGRTGTSESFSYRGFAFPTGADVKIEFSYLEALWRMHLLDRPHLKLAMIVGPRFVRANVQASSTLSTVTGDDFLVLPEVGAMLEARPFPRSILFGLVKYMDLTSNGSGSHTLQLEGGLSYLIPAPTDTYVGWRLTGGFRYLNLQAVRQRWETNQFGFDLEASGPYLEVSRVF